MASEPKEDCVHFLVLTDVCGNRTYGAVVQYCRPLRVCDGRDVPRKSGRGSLFLPKYTPHATTPVTTLVAVGPWC